MDPFIVQLASLCREHVTRKPRAEEHLAGGRRCGGRRLQHALYGLAAVELLRARYKNPEVTGAEYYFSSHKGRHERVPIPAPTLAQTAAVLGDLREISTTLSFAKSGPFTSGKGAR